MHKNMGLNLRHIKLKEPCLQVDKSIKRNNKDRWMNSKYVGVNMFMQA